MMKTKRVFLTRTLHDFALKELKKRYEIEVHSVEIPIPRKKLESKIKEEFQNLIEKITNQDAMFKEVKKIPQNKINALKMLFSIEEDRRWKSKNSN